MMVWLQHVPQERSIKTSGDMSMMVGYLRGSQAACFLHSASQHGARAECICPSPKNECSHSLGHFHCAQGTMKRHVLWMNQFCLNTMIWIHEYSLTFAFVTSICAVFAAKILTAKHLSETIIKQGN